VKGREKNGLRTGEITENRKENVGKITRVIDGAEKVSGAGKGLWRTLSDPKKEDKIEEEVFYSGAQKDGN